jgi:hypothetical protein
MVPVAVAPAHASVADDAPLPAPSPVLGRITEEWPVVLGDARPGTRDPDVVVVDGRRPVALWLHDGRFRRVVPVSARALADEEPLDVLRRALDRAASVRFHPVVVVDRHGDLVGVVPVDRLARLAAER